MKVADLIGTAVSNTLRARARTALTVLAIVVGAFTLTLTTGVGAGINQYIDEAVAGFGVQDVLHVTKVDDDVEDATRDGPRPYDPNVGTAGTFGFTVPTLTDADITNITDIEGVHSAEPVLAVAPTYLQSRSGDRFELSLDIPTNANNVQYDAGRAPDPDAAQIAVPANWIDELGYDTAEKTVGTSVQIAMTNALGQEKLFDAEISGVVHAALTGAEAWPFPSQTLLVALHGHQVGGSAQRPDTYASATVVVDSPERVDQVKAVLATHGLDGSTVEDQLGIVRSVVNGIIWVLNGFAIIALVAAGFGIVNTLLMSVQERTREIGLMKALGMGGMRVFGLFSLEAVAVGLLGSAIGVGIGMGVGSAVSRVLSAGVLSGLPGLRVFVVDPPSLALIVLGIMVVAFFAGTLPAARAAHKDPILALRYE